MAEPADWQRVGEMLQQQRVTLDPRYKNRALFSRDRGINYRLSQDVETGARDNYELSTLTHIELAYGWQPGDIEAVLNGGRPRLRVPEGIPRIVREHWDNETVRHHWQDETLPEAGRLQLIEFFLAIVEANRRRQDAEVTELRRADGA